MELPDNLKNLYRHWGGHIISEKSLSPAGSLFSDQKLFSDISYFINERLSIWRKKTSGIPEPYTDDPILKTFRFCNIFREFDRQTIEFHALLNPIRDNFSLWLLNMFYCRMIANPKTVNHAGLLAFDKKRNNIVYQSLLNAPRPRFGTPYVFPISTILKSDTPTRELFLARYLPTIIPKVAETIFSWRKKNVYDGIKEIVPLFGFNLNFLWTEVLIDTAYQFPERINLFGRFPIGPGSLPTMKKINPHSDSSFLASSLGNAYFPLDLTYENNPILLSAENWEGIGCEFRKYTNLKNGEGRRRIYKSSGN